ncbi:LacI family transcriptional regulator [Cellulomonas sp. WB94]|uniref:LacI family DNA-binding transcriptional regulator n=1 Tax=Cellulomonas sp. WB94 TaxID=2173174 RepID=UPI000D57D06D|nr:LacI family DNA-binding transcriptional regulator [Cellulomonas sp. WB94]PVU81146.1 LacI family transcriptional regulator [Cellulomonas sp. WB94]
MTREFPRRPAPTIYDVARVAGVATSTVSRAFARPGRVNADTAARIRAVAEDLGYRANPIARALSTSRTRMLAVMISDITNPFYAELVRWTQLAAQEAGYVILLVDAQESDTLERETLERLLPVVDGIVIGSSRMSDSALRTIAKQKPMVVLNRELTGVPSVVTDSLRGMRRAVEHLGGLAHDTITYVAGPDASWADGMRWRALREAGHELDLVTRRIGPFAPTFAGGLKAAGELAAYPTTAVIAYNDPMAIGVIRGLERAGLRVPEDVSVIGFDDTLMSRLVRPALTTVAAPLREMGATGVRDLLAVLNGAQAETGHAFVLPVRLVVRGSTAQCSRKSTSPALGTTNVSGSAS